MQAVMRPNFGLKINFGKVLMVFAVVAAFTLMFSSPAHAFGEFQTKVTEKTGEATKVGRTILLAAAVLSLIVGIAPMLWGQVKVKWLVSCLIAAVLFGLAGPMITAFTVPA